MDQVGFRHSLGSLIGPGGILEPVHQHDLPVRQRRADDVGEVLGAIRVEEQKLGLRAPGLAARVGREEQGPQFPAQGRASGFLGDHQRQPRPAQPLRQPLDLGGLPGTLHPLPW